ncbi:MAG: hypothetical protein J6O50_11015 [Ruminiclostridium sp.]|nr:hypothetical protein [Ruminiclostridium sp.]
MDDYIHTEITADFIRKAFSECEHIMFYDLETTGLDPHECRIIEFSAVKFDICKPASVSEPVVLKESNKVTVYIKPEEMLSDDIFNQVYHDDAVICLFRVELEKGEVAGFYNTRTGKFSSPFHMNATNVFHFGMSMERLFLWAYAAFTTNEMLPKTESYRNVMIDPYAEVTFTSIPGKLRVPTNCKHIRNIAGTDGYESTVKHINGYIRKLPEGQKASEKAVAIAESLGYSLAPDETYVCPFERTAWITGIKG